MANDYKQRKIALERINNLFNLAEREFSLHQERSHRNVALARKISMRYNVRIPPELRRRLCKKCYKYLKPNVNCIARTGKGIETFKCLECGNVTRRRLKANK